MINARRTDMGKLMSMGRRTVNIATDNVRLEECGWKSIHASLVLSRTVKEMRKKIHSRRMLVRLVTSIARP